jgi:uncharacterized protein YecE (DUF72 family)
MRIHIGTSGYNYPEWRGSFYPEKMSAKQMFPYYAERFHTVEINYTFYRMPTEKTTQGWRDQAPQGFMYTLKAPKTISHIKRLKDAEDTLAFFCNSARALGPHLAALLFQLPPNFKCDVARLETFLAAMPADVRPAFEFRHDSWLNDQVYDLLAAKSAALAIADFGDKTTPLRATAKHGYFRLRDEGYTPSDLERWVDRLLEVGSGWDDAFVYFKHEEAGKGPEFAKTFAEILDRHGALGL